MHWLGEFQVLTCIPIRGSVPLRDVAELTGVPELQLRHVVRMMTTAGFLREPTPGHVAHSALSTPFVSKPPFLDAAMFLAETAAPAAMKMTLASHRFGDSSRASESAYNVAIESSVPFATACEQSAKLQRQWTAYMQYGMGDVRASMVDVLMRLHWARLEAALVVEVTFSSFPSTSLQCSLRFCSPAGHQVTNVCYFSTQVGAQSMPMSIATTFAAQHPTLRFIVQMNNLGPNGFVPQPFMSSPWSLSQSIKLHSVETSAAGTPMLDESQLQLNSRITVQQRYPGSPQSITDAAVYIVHLPFPVPGMSSRAVSTRIIAELNAHIGVLRANISAALVLTARLLPEPGTIDPYIESIVGLQNLLRTQLDNEQEIESLNVMELIRSVGDNMGRLVLINKLSSQDNTTVAFELRYQAYGQSEHLQK